MPPQEYNYKNDHPEADLSLDAQLDELKIKKRQPDLL